jgi:hypothetical protein
MKFNVNSAFTEFKERLNEGSIEIYNEASVQFELGVIIRELFGMDYALSFERNITTLGLNKVEFLKKEMDLYVSSVSGDGRHCIEIKYPTNGQYPEQMYASCKDIRFLEQLAACGFAPSYFLFLTSDMNFYNDKEKEGIYRMFRKEKSLHGMIKKPTGHTSEYIELMNVYKMNWLDLKGKLKYFLISVG